jgi:DNA-binding GntR family transcriptional regulator
MSDILKDELRQAMKAREVLENDAFKDAVQKIDQALLAGMRNAAIRDAKLRLRLLDKYEALHDLLDQLQSTVNTGLLAEEEIRRKTISERVKEMLHIN